MYVGHTSTDGRKEPLLEHLTKVAKSSQKYAKSFGAEDLAYLIGYFHDIGKYSDAAQKRLLENGCKVDHATAGAQEMMKLCGATGAYCIMGHHGGLPNGGSPADTGGESTFHGRLKKQIHVYSAFRTELQWKPPAEPKFTPLNKMGFSISFFIRMLFSCLVDADYLETEQFMEQKDPRSTYQSIEALHEKMKAYIEHPSHPTSPLNEKRSEILQNCLDAGKKERGLYSLTVPTGGGKTISSLSFALAHAKENHMERVIYVIPYTSIIEQNAAVFANILGEENVLEHHSNMEYDNEDKIEQRLYLATENWDAPVVVTTSVQFFQSLFGAKPSQCRKLHNIANSVIIFDEAQMLPNQFLTPCTRAIGELIYNYNCTAVLCSATQPALDGIFPPEIKRTEICENYQELYTYFRRTTLEKLGQLTDETLAQRLNNTKQVLCIVNTRKQAQNLYKLLEEEGSYHLSTSMYPKHRKQVLQEIRDRLQDKLPCRVVATSLIEAGVDVNFPTVYRARAGLDSIIQAAGRCNREGKGSAEESKVYIFDPEENYSRPSYLNQPMAALEAIAPHYEDITSPDAIFAYFEQLYKIQGGSLDQKEIVPRLEDGYNTRNRSWSFPFQDVARDVQIIESKTHTVLIPYDEESISYAKCLRNGERNKKLLRQIGHYSVQVFDNHFEELFQMGIVEELDKEIAVLAEMGSYSQQMGLTLTPECGKGIFFE